MATYPAALDLIDAAAAPVFPLDATHLIEPVTAELRPMSVPALLAQAPASLAVSQSGRPYALALPSARAVELVLRHALASLDPAGIDGHVQLEWGADGIGIVVSGPGCPAAQALSDERLHRAVAKAGGTLRIGASGGGVVVSAVIPRGHAPRWHAITAHRGPSAARGATRRMRPLAVQRRD